MKDFLLRLYQIGLLAFGISYLLSRALKGRELPGLKERLASYSPEQRRRLDGMDGPVWIHLVSVGEALAARPFIQEMRCRFPEKKWVITTVTATGREVAQKNFQDKNTEVLYLPWDVGSVVRRALSAIRPSLFIAFETELWPVLFHHLHKTGVPIAVVNGRISPKAYQRYLWIRPLMQRALEPVGLFITQSPQDARRYASIGAAQDRIAVSGNMKWDLSSAPGKGAQPEKLRAALGMGADEKLWAAGSTHEGEEKILFSVYNRLKERQPGLRLLVAPRHPERVSDVEQEARQAGIKTIRWSELRPSPTPSPQRGEGRGEGDSVILLDTVGELTSFYAISEFVFVGGSLIPHGGHNLVEPASMGLPILTGPHLQNFQAIAESLRQANALLIVPSETELEQAVGRLLNDPRQAKELGARANGVFQQNYGAVKRTVELITLRWGRRLAGHEVVV